MSSVDVLYGTITLGDWSEDGHNIHHAMAIEIPLDLKAPAGSEDDWRNDRDHSTWGCSKSPNLWFYFKLAIADGIPDVTKSCEEYEEPYASPEDVAVWKERLGVTLEGELEDEDDEESRVMLEDDEYAAVWIATVNHGIKLNGETVSIRKVPRTKVLNWNIGGYGLYSG